MDLGRTFIDNSSEIYLLHISVNSFGIHLFHIFQQIISEIHHLHINYSEIHLKNILSSNKIAFQ